MLFNLKEAAMKNTNALLIGSFCLLILAKALLSFRFHSPWMMPDEVSYAKMAANIFGSVHPTLSPGYPLFLSIAYLSSGNMNVVYHCMLLINCFLSSLIQVLRQGLRINGGGAGGYAALFYSIHISYND